MQVAPGAFEKKAEPFAVEDDHAAFQRAGIPCFAVIDFEYEPFCSITEDTPDKWSV